MRTFERSLSANESWSIAGGNFFLLMTAANAVDVVFFRGGSEVGRMTEVTAGYWVRFTEEHLKQLGIAQGFDRVAVVNGSTAQTVKVVTAQEEAGANIVSSEISSILNPLIPESLGTGTHFSYSADSALKTLVTPAANVNGVDVITAVFDGWNNVGSRLMAKTSAPTAWNDSAALNILATNAAGAGPNIAVLARPVRVPAGYGLYLQSSSAASTLLRSVNWTVL